MSVPRNIIEGNEHESPRERKRFFGYALASVSEAEGHMQTGLDLGMISSTDFNRLVAQVIDIRKMLYGLLRGLDA
jgi:four helix bundle protein